MKAIKPKISFRILCLALILACVAWYFESCGGTQDAGAIADGIRENSTTNINGFILDKLKRNRVVMLSDSRHGSSLYLQSVIRFLNYWVDNLDNPFDSGYSIPRKLFLVRETAPDEGAQVRQFLDTGELFESFSYRYIMWVMNTARVEYYDDLRRLVERIDSINNTLPPGRKIEFKLMFPEKAIDRITWTRAWADTFFISQRDEYSSQRVSDSLEAHPDYRALIFYGSAHLNKHRAVKRGYNMSGEGYYLAHYLTQRFGDMGGVYTIYQSVNNAMGDMSGFYRAVGHDFAIDNHRLGTGMIPKDYKKVGADGEIVYFDSDPEFNDLMLYQIHSMRMVKYLIDNMARFSLSSDSISENYMRGALRDLPIIVGTRFDDYREGDPESAKAIVRKWKNWYDTTSMDMVAELESQAIYNRILGYMATSEGRKVNWYEGVICECLGLNPSYDTAATPAERADEYRQYIAHYRRRLLLRDLTGLLWIGYESEFTKALAVLKKETGEEFTTAREWANWLRKNEENIPADTP